jgi:replicative DNA helicase
MSELSKFENVTEYIEHLKSLTTSAVLEHEIIHYEFVIKNGWDINPLKKYLEAAKIDVKEAEKLNQEEEKKEIAKQLEEKATKTLEEVKSTTDPDKKIELLKTIGDRALVISKSNELKPYTWQDYMDDINKYDPTKEFYPKLFTVLEDDNETISFRLPFPPQTFSVVGARTKRGKTIMLVNLALDALESGRKCIFISLEMTKRQLLNKLVLLRVYSQAVKEMNSAGLENLRKLENPSATLQKFLKFLKNKTDKENESNIYKVAQSDNINRMFLGAVEFMQDKMDRGELELIDATLSKQVPIIYKVSQVNKGAIVLIDYIQRIPEEEGHDYDGGYMRVTKINKELINATLKSEAITICAAQFNRMGGTDSGGADIFDDTSFKESGSIEQDAHNAIGIGYEGNKEDRFFEILKARESSGTGYQFSLEFNGAYSYMSNEGNRDRAGKDKPKEEKTENINDSGKKKQWKYGAAFSDPKTIY